MTGSGRKRAEAAPSRGFPNDAGRGETVQQPQRRLGGHPQTAGQRFGGHDGFAEHPVEDLGQTRTGVQAGQKRLGGLGRGLKAVELLQPGARGFGHQSQENPEPRGGAIRKQSRGHVTPEPGQAVQLAGGKGRSSGPDGQGDGPQSAASGQQAGADTERGGRGGEIREAGFHPLGGRKPHAQQRGDIAGRRLRGAMGQPGRHRLRVASAHQRRQRLESRIGIGEQPGLARELLQQPGEGEGGLDMAFAQQPGVRVHLLPLAPGGVGQVTHPDQMAGPQGQVAWMHPGTDRGEPAGGLAEGEPGNQAGADRFGGGIGPGVQPGERVLGGAQRAEQTRRIGSGQPVGRGRAWWWTAGKGRGVGSSSAQTGRNQGSSSVSDGISLPQITYWNLARTMQV